MDVPRVVDDLAPHEAESGLVTAGEMETARTWLDRVSPGDEGEFGGASPVDGWLGAGAPFALDYAGEPLLQRLPEWSFAAEADRGGTGDGPTYAWTDPETGLRLTWDLRTFEGFPAADWVLRFENASETETRLVEDPRALDITLVRDPDRPVTLHGANGGRSERDDMLPFSVALPSPEAQDAGLEDQDSYRLGGANPSSNRHLPFFGVELPSDRGVLVGVGWSGQWVADVEADDDRVRASVGLDDCRFVLEPGERLRGPRVLVLPWRGERLHGHNVFRRLLDEAYVPDLPDGERPLASANVAFSHDGEGHFLEQATEDDVLPLADAFADLGVELFTVDAGWYRGTEDGWVGGTGDWRVDPGKYPDGFGAIRDRLDEDGVRFGLWFAPEVVGEHSPLHDEHPEWVQEFYPETARDSLRLDHPGAREWMLDRVSALVEEAGVDCYRQDGNHGNYGPDARHRQGVAEMTHVAALYEFWDALRERHPDLVMEGCSGGGRRIDLETVSRFHWFQKSDRWFDSASDQSGLYGANLYLPGGYVHVFTGGEDGGTDDYTAWSSFAGQYDLSCHPLAESFDAGAARRQVELYREVRALLRGDFYPLTPPGLEQPVLGYQFHRPDRGAGVAFAFRRPHAGAHPVDDQTTLDLRGLDPGRQYEARFVAADRTATVDGAALRDGVEVALPDAPDAEMVVYRPAE